MRKKLRFAAILLLGLVFAVSVGMLIYRLSEYKKGAETYAEAAELVGLPDLSDLSALPSSSPSPSSEQMEEDEDGAEEEPAEASLYIEALQSVDLQALKEVNSEVLGWIVIPDTLLSYPLLQGTDNSYYLSHTWDNEASAVGAIFMDYRCDAELDDFHTIIYGHRMKSSTVPMFATLKYYNDQSYWEEHPCIYIADDNGVHCYNIFAAYEVSVSGVTYQVSFSDDTEKQAFLDFCTEQSVISTGITPTVSDRILTLSTCTGNGHATRWVVQGIQVS